MHEQIAPASNPIPLAELRLYCTIPHSAYDTQLAEDAAAAVEYLEGRTDSLLLARAVQATYYGGEPLYLRGPHAIVTSVSVDGVPQQASTYSVVQHGHTIRLLVQPQQYAKVEVTYQAGYAANSLPALVRKSIKSYVCGHYQNRAFGAQVQLYELQHGLEASISVLGRSRRVG